MNLGYHYHFYSVKNLKTVSTELELSELSLYPASNTKGICMVAPFWDNVFLKADTWKMSGSTAAGQTHSTLCRTGTLQMNSDLEQVSFPTSGKKGSFCGFFYLCYVVPILSLLPVWY